VWGIENLTSQSTHREVNSLPPQYQHSKTYKHSATWWKAVYPPMACNEVPAKSMYIKTRFNTRSQ
ncbi:hypothetical protein, partial [Pseudoalteromonas sp. JC3]|uniref:hypothetical protein n=1 Tax=Pseudoalteromonas sp. JC3 TaxID=2810196 RepID=UPI0019D177D2